MPTWSIFAGLVCILLLIHSHTDVFATCRFNSPQNGLSVPVAFMGAPTVLIEKVTSGTEMFSALEGIKKLLISGVCEKSNDLGKKSAGGLEVKQSTKYPEVYEAFGLDKIKLPQDDSELPVVCYYYSVLSASILSVLQIC